MTGRAKRSASDRADVWPAREPSGYDQLSTNELGPPIKLAAGVRLDAALAVTKRVERDGNDIGEAREVFEALDLIPAGWTGTGAQLLDVLASGEKWRPPQDGQPCMDAPHACPTCDALPDTPCTSVVTGKPLKVVHNDRRRV